MKCCLIFFLGQIPLLKHERKDEIASRKATLGVAERGITVGRSDDPREHGALSDVELCGADAEVVLRGVFNSECAVSEVNGIEVQEEDLLFGVFFFEGARKFHFLELAVDRLFA